MRKSEAEKAVALRGRNNTARRGRAREGGRASSSAISEYLAEIGRRGGENSRRELFPSHAKRMVDIREMKRAAIRAGKTWPPRDRKTLKLLKLS